MNQKAQTFAALAENTASQLTKSYTEWTGFLSSIGRLYKDVCCKRWNEDFTQYSIAAGSVVVKPAISRGLGSYRNV